MSLQSLNLFRLISVFVIVHPLSLRSSYAHNTECESFGAGVGVVAAMFFFFLSFSLCPASLFVSFSPFFG